MSETGFGALSFTPAPEYKDYGFGTPTPLDIGASRDTGFGSPYDPSNLAVEMPGDLVQIPDNGGVTLRFVRDWSATAGDFPVERRYLGAVRVELIERATGLITLAQGSRGKDCFTNYRQDNLLAYAPPLARGSYDIRITWEQINSIYIEDGIEVVARARCAEAYSIRTHLPSWSKRGAYRVEDEIIDIYKRGSNLQALTQSIGDALQVLNGRPTTGTTAEFTSGSSVLHVDSTLGYPDAGALFIEGERFTYTGKTLTSFTGVTADLLQVREIQPRRKVSLDVKSVK